MKKRLFLASTLVFALSMGAFAQFKVVEKSSKKAPAWYQQIEADYLIVSAQEYTLEAAQKACMMEVKRQIIQAVAQNISFAETSSLQQTLSGEEIAEFVDTYSSSTDVKTATVPFVQGISLSKVEDFYWEKLENKQNHEVYYNYTIKYPFTQLELKKLVRDFEERDQQYEAQLTELEQHLNEIQSIEDIQASILKIAPLKEYFFDNVRRQRAQALEKSYRELYNMIAIQGYSSKVGEYVCQFYLQGKPIAISTIPKLKSDCASQLSAFSANDGKEIHIVYNADDCLETEENTIEAIFRIGGKAVSHKIYIDVTKQMIAVVPEGKVYLTAESQTDSTLTNINVRITLNSKYATPFIVRNVVLEIPGLNNTLVKDNMGQTYSGVGTYTLEVTADGDWQRVPIQKYLAAFIKGTIDIENPQTHATTRVSINLPYVANWK